MSALGNPHRTKMPAHPKQLKICAWNANGRMLERKLELETLFMEHDIDASLLSETLLSEKKKFKLRDYTIYENNTNRGTAIAVKSTCDHHEYPIPNLEVLEATAIKVRVQGVELAVVSTYKSPSVKFNENDYNKIFNLSQAVNCSRGL